MPELPEVETLRRSLSGLTGLTVQTIRFSRLAPIETTTATKIKTAFLKARIVKLQRYGKYLLLSGDKGCHLVLHLGMSGQLRHFPAKQVQKKLHRHMEIGFDDGSYLEFVDPRRFGTISLCCDINYEDNPFLQRLGPDYLDPKLTNEIFIRNCRRHPKLSLKALALNQKVATGLGNIYACEALYGAKLDPRRLVATCTAADLKRLLKTARIALELGVRHGGVSMRDYLDGNGHRGVMKEFLQVYDREGQASLDGRGKVERIEQNARSTFWVPSVQK